AARKLSSVKSLLSFSTLMACTPRGDSDVPRSTYTGKFSRLGLSGPAADHGQLFTLYSQPVFGFIRPGVSSIDSRPFHSEAGSLPSTGLLQSYFGSRRGMKLEWKYAIVPSASA